MELEVISELDSSLRHCAWTSDPGTVMRVPRMPRSRAFHPPDLEAMDRRSLPDEEAVAFLNDFLDSLEPVVQQSEGAPLD